MKTAPKKSGRTKGPKVERLNLTVTPRGRKQIEQLVKRTGAASITEVIQRAVAAYDFLVEEKEKGGELVVRNGDKEKSVVLL